MKAEDKKIELIADLSLIKNTVMIHDEQRI